jgi:lysophospholipase L1-like esterase
MLLQLTKPYPTPKSLKTSTLYIALSAAMLIFPSFLNSYSTADAQTLADNTGDGAINLLAFGDSITYGVGDGIAPGEVTNSIDESGAPRGYPLRLSSQTSVGVENGGEPGERFIYEGLARLIHSVLNTDIDAVILMEGTNDAIHQIDERDYRINMQRAINVIRAEGRGLILNTLPPPTADRADLAPYTALYSSILRELAQINSTALADVEQHFIDSCPDLTTCKLYNLPEGLHPNTLGYDAIVDVVSSALQR